MDNCDSHGRSSSTGSEIKRVYEYCRHSSVLREENLEQLSADEEERNWEDELEVLSARLQEPVNINTDRKSTRLNSSHGDESRMPSSA